MKIRFEEYGFFGKQFRINKGEFNMISSLESNTIEVEGNEKLEIKDRLLKSASIDLGNYDTDLDIFLFNVASAFRGKVVAVVAPLGTKIDIYNRNENT